MSRRTLQAVIGVLALIPTLTGGAGGAVREYMIADDKRSSYPASTTRSRWHRRALSPA